MTKKLSQTKLAVFRDEILDDLEVSINQMPPSQAIEFLDELKSDIENLINERQDEIATAKAEVACDCKERGRQTLHTKKCAKTKAVANL